MLFREKIAIYSEDHTKPLSTLCGKTREVSNVKGGDT
jgi:hypothetical protein